VSQRTGACAKSGERRIVLPGFGAFTGGQPILPAPGERVFVGSGETVLEVPL
jgi:hypothetical protein